MLSIATTVISLTASKNSFRLVLVCYLKTISQTGSISATPPWLASRDPSLNANSASRVENISTHLNSSEKTPANLQTTIQDSKKTIAWIRFEGKSAGKSIKIRNPRIGAREGSSCGVFVTRYRFASTCKSVRTRFPIGSNDKVGLRNQTHLAMVFIPTEFIPEYRPSRKHSLFSSDGWWLNRWPLLGWLETFVKVAAWCFVPYVPVQDAPMVPFDRISQPFAVETAIMLVAAALIAAAIIDRMVYREIVSMIFVFPNNWAHWTVAMAMYRGGRDGVNIRYFRIFCWLMLAGDIVKLIFFAVHDFTRLDVARYVLYVLVAFFAVMYSVILLIDYGYLGPSVSKLYKSLPLAYIFAYRRT